MKKTIKKRAFVSAIAMLIVSAIVLTSSTFAWFSMSKLATVEQMDLTVSSPAGIQISANAKAWTSSLTIDQIFPEDTSTDRYKAYEGNVNLKPIDLIPASCGFLTQDGIFAKFYRANVNDKGYGSVTAVTQTAGSDDVAGFVAFDLFFKVTEETTVYFGTSEFADSSESDILTALRVGFQFMGNTDSTDPATATGLKESGGNNNIIYEVNSTGRSADAAAAGNSTGYIATKYIAGDASQAVTDNFVLDNTGTKAPTCKLLKDTDTNNAKSFTLKAGVSKVRVYIWIEGNDIDCRNSVAGSAFSAALKFTIV